MTRLFVIFLIAGCSGSSSVSQAKPDAEASPSVDSVQHSSEGTAAALGNCRIIVQETNVWRDWMPIVDKPGPDGGSPLHVKIRLRLDNSAGDEKKLSFEAAVVDDKGQSHAIDAHYVQWNGELKHGESRAVELSAADGPYVPVGSSVRVVMTWTDQAGDSLTLSTPESTIFRTD